MKDFEHELAVWIEHIAVWSDVAYVSACDQACSILHDRIGPLVIPVELLARNLDVVAGLLRKYGRSCIPWVNMSDPAITKGMGVVADLQRVVAGVPLFEMRGERVVLVDIPLAGKAGGELVAAIRNALGAGQIATRIGWAQWRSDEVLDPDGIECVLD